MNDLYLDFYHQYINAFRRAEALKRAERQARQKMKDVWVDFVTECRELEIDPINNYHMLIKKEEDVYMLEFDTDDYSPPKIKESPSYDVVIIDEGLPGAAQTIIKGQM